MVYSDLNARIGKSTFLSSAARAKMVTFSLYLFLLVAVNPNSWYN